MSEMCFFNQPWSDGLQHIAIVFEISAIWLIYRDYKNRNSDLAKKDRASWMRTMPIPHADRTNEMRIAYIVGGIAIIMELYQLASQYWGC